jgi:hypothetical protein
VRFGSFAAPVPVVKTASRRGANEHSVTSLICSSEEPVMLFRWLAVPLFLLPLASVHAEALESLSRSEMRPRQLYEFRTTGRTYRAEVVDQATGECLVSASHDGTAFSRPRKAYLLGATAGPQSGVSLVLMGQFKIGLGIELALENHAKPNRFLTPSVTAITLVEQPGDAGPQTLQ